MPPAPTAPVRGKSRSWSDKHYRWVSDGKGNWQVQAYKVHHKHRPPRGHPRGPGTRPAYPSIPRGQPPQNYPGQYEGTFGPEQARRLLDRAGFGPRPGEAEALAQAGLRRAVHSLTRPRQAPRLIGPEPVDQDGLPIAPADAYGHDHLWWLDRMVRVDQPLVERMALIFHDWFATSNAGVSRQQQMIDQSNLMRTDCFGSFLRLFRDITVNPAMLQWLSGSKNRKGHPNENYSREMMELFSLGAERDAYTEDDIREQARALTGWRSRRSPERGAYDFRFDRSRHDQGLKTVFGRRGHWDWKDACRLCVENPKHPSFFVEKLWSYFVPTPPSAQTKAALIGTYRSSGWRIHPVVEAILMHNDLYSREPMVKPPVVYLASMLRAIGRGIDTTAWINFGDLSGQLLFWPPNVSGWDDAHWLDTSRMRGRWKLVDRVIARKVAALEHPYSQTETPAEALARALDTWGGPLLEPADEAELLDLGTRIEALARNAGQQGSYRRLRQIALLQLIGLSTAMVLG